MSTTNIVLEEVREKVQSSLEEVLQTIRQEFPNIRPSTREGVMEQDKWFAKQLAFDLLCHILRPYAITKQEDLESIIRPSQFGAFATTELSRTRIIEMITHQKALYKGHFHLLSGLHSKYFLTFARIAASHEYLAQVSTEIVGRFQLKSTQLSAVVGPVTAGGLFAREIARLLEVNMAFLDVDDRSRSSHIYYGDNVVGPVLLVNDIVTTGKGLRNSIKIVQDGGGEIIGVALFATRGANAIVELKAIQEEYRVPIQVLTHLDVDAEEPPCSLCKTGRILYDSRRLN